jgi:hypothetical protein
VEDDQRKVDYMVEDFRRWVDTSWAVDGEDCEVVDASHYCHFHKDQMAANHFVDVVGKRNWVAGPDDEELQASLVVVSDDDCTREKIRTLVTCQRGVQKSAWNRHEVM